MREAERKRATLDQGAILKRSGSCLALRGGFSPGIHRSPSWQKMLYSLGILQRISGNFPGRGYRGWRDQHGRKTYLFQWGGQFVLESSFVSFGEVHRQRN